MGFLEAQIQCPHCWQMLTVLVEPEPEAQEYVEDCQVCCAPILVKVELADGEVMSIAGERES